MHHNKVLELLALVVIGAGLVPLHHRLEHLVLTKLTQHRVPMHAIPVTNEQLIADASLPADVINNEGMAENKTASAAGTTEADDK